MVEKTTHGEEENETKLILSEFTTKLYFWILANTRISQYSLGKEAKIDLN
jgi:hypothetical protein